MDDLAAQTQGLDAIAQAELVRSGEVSPSELVEAAISRIEDLNPALGAVVHQRFNKARAEAAGPLPPGPFRGVPILLKALGGLIEGAPDDQANALLKELGQRSRRDANLVQLMRRAGFVVLGLTSTSEFGLSSTAESACHGPTVNPWDKTKSTGGSSGGSAAAVAAGFVPVAHGTDGGGSLRMPASHCGVVGFKPSRGRVSLGPESGDPLEGHNVAGVITSSVRDSAAVLDVISVPMPGDPVVAPSLEHSFLTYARTVPKRLRVGVMVVEEVGGVNVSPEVNREVLRVAGVLKDCGHHVVYDFPEALIESDYRETFIDLLSPSVTALIDALADQVGRPLDRHEVEEVTWFWFERGRSISAADHVRNQVWRDAFRRRVAGWWERGFDVLLSPVVAGTAHPLGYLAGERGVKRSLEMLCFTPQFNTTGQPAVALPTGMSAEGLPIGVQLVAGYGREDVLFSLSSQVEIAIPWADRRPPTVVKL